jgi:ascorbate PTS system EIIC component
MIMLFFPGAAAGVFGNALAGWRGAVIGGVINGLFLAVGQAVTWGMLSDTAPELATLADPDWYLMIWLMLGVGTLFSGLGAGGIWGVPIVIAVVFAVWVALLQRRQVAPSAAPMTGESPFEPPDAAARSRGGPSDEGSAGRDAEPPS